MTSKNRGGVCSSPKYWGTALVLLLVFIYLLSSTICSWIVLACWNRGGIEEYTGRCIEYYYEGHRHRNNECFLLDNGIVIQTQSRILKAANFNTEEFRQNQSSEMTFLYTRYNGFGSRMKEIIGIRLHGECLLDESVTKDEVRIDCIFLSIFTTIWAGLVLVAIVSPPKKIDFLMRTVMIAKKVKNGLKMKD